MATMPPIPRNPVPPPAGEGQRMPQLTVLAGAKAAPLATLDRSSHEDGDQELQNSSAEARRHLQLVVWERELPFEEEVLKVLREQSPEASPASPEGRRLGQRILIAVAVVESALMIGFGWYLRGWEGAFFGFLALIFFGLARAFLLILAGIARARDWSRAEEVTRARRKARKARLHQGAYLPER